VAAVAAIQQISATIGQVSEIATAIAARQQGTATADIARNVQQTSVGTQNVTAHIADVNAAADNVLDFASTLAKQAEEVRRR
jgi:methyl-accepting chemotaxis protein